MKVLAKSAIFLSIFVALISFVKFDHCRNSGWAAPDDFVHACYSDYPSLFSERNLDVHAWPYASKTNAVEYPPITGIVMWATSYAVPHNSNQYRTYFDINALLVALLLIATVLILKQMKPELWHLFPLAPAVIASLYINWDIWAVISALGAIYYFDKNKYSRSALLLGISIATKFFPIVLLLPVSIIFIRRREIKNLLSYGFVTLVTWLAINLPFILTTPIGWFRFFKLNSLRPADWGSIWEALSLLGFNIKNVNQLSIFLFLAGAMLYTIYIWYLKKIPTLASSSFLIVAIFVTASKVYSPQYIIWLTPLAVLALVNIRDRIIFWVWQGSELIYHFAIWQYLATVTGAHFAITGGVYATASLLRIAALAWFAGQLMRKSTPEIDPHPTAFSSNASKGYA